MVVDDCSIALVLKGRLVVIAEVRTSGRMERFWLACGLDRPGRSAAREYFLIRKVTYICGDVDRHGG
jgi:hypothetical protein